MPAIQINQLNGLNLYINPLLKNAGDLIHAVNVDSFPYGAKTKRPGYVTFNGTADGSAVNSLFQFVKNDGTTNYLYRASGTQLYYYDEGSGTGDWTACGTGSLGAGNHAESTILNDTLVICDGVGSTRHSTNGTSFTNTTLAPVAVSLEQYQNRVYAAGTASTLFYSTTGDPTNWNTSGTSDSSSFTIPGGGKLLKVMKQNDRLIATKNSGAVFKWDGYNLADTATTLGPTSPYSVAKVEDYLFWLNRNGVYGYSGLKPQLISNAVQRQIYNNAGSGIVGGTFSSAPSAIHRFDYFLAMGTVTDDFTNITVDNAILKYDYQKNEFLNWKFANFPTSMLSYKDRNGVQQFIWGDSTGQCYKLSGTATNDNGSAIDASMIYLIDGGIPYLDKKWNYLWAFFNPGNEAKIQIAVANTYIKQSLNWIEIGDCSSGVLQYRFPSNTRGKLLFVKVYESSRNSQFSFYGMSVDMEPMLVY